MYDNWSEVRTQLDQVLASEQVRRQARRRQQPSLWQLLRRWWVPAQPLTSASTPAPRSILGAAVSVRAPRT